MTCLVGDDDEDDMKGTFLQINMVANGVVGSDNLVGGGGYGYFAR